MHKFMLIPSKFFKLVAHLVYDITPHARAIWSCGVEFCLGFRIFWTESPFKHLDQSWENKSTVSKLKNSLVPRIRN